MLKITGSLAVLGFALAVFPGHVQAQEKEKAKNGTEAGSFIAPAKAGSLGRKPAAGSFSSGKPRAGSLTVGKPQAGSLSAGKPAAGSMVTGVVGGSLARPVGERGRPDTLSARQRRLSREEERAEEREAERRAEERAEEDDDSTRSRSERPRRVRRRD